MPSLARRFARATLSDLLRAGVELGLARLRLNSRETRAWISAAPTEPDPLESAHLKIVDRVSFVIPRVAARLPWRADCLVQALAAKRWLAREGISTILSLGVPRDKPANFEAHAWLTAGDRVVTGGDVSGYEPFVRP